MESVKRDGEPPDGKQGKDIINNIIENYKKLEESIVAQLAIRHQYHGAETGTLREDIWLQLFEQILPKKFYIEHSVFIIDSHGNISNEIDLAVVDRSYTPYIFQYGRLKFIPIEAVAAVVECKSQSPGKESIKAWIEAVKALKTDTDSVVRLATGIIINGDQYKVIYSDSDKKTDSGDIAGKCETQASPAVNAKQPSAQTATRPIRIFCGYMSGINTDDYDFDIYLIAGGNSKPDGIEMTVTDKYKNLEDWYCTLNHSQTDLEAEAKNKIVCRELRNPNYSIEKYRVGDGGREVSLLSFNFLLNQLLMLINNPIPFPHISYAQMFNKHIAQGSREGGNDKK